MAWKSETENSRLQAGPWTCWVRSSAATASEQRGHWLNLDLLSHSASRCSVRLAISTTCKHNTELYWKSSSVRRWLNSWADVLSSVHANTSENVTGYLSTFIAASQHRTVFPVVKVQSNLCEGLILFTTEYTRSERSDQAADQIIFLQSTGTLTT